MGTQVSSMLPCSHILTWPGWPVSPYLDRTDYLLAVEEGAVFLLWLPPTPVWTFSWAGSRNSERRHM